MGQKRANEHRLQENFDDFLTSSYKEKQDWSATVRSSMRTFISFALFCCLFSIAQCASGACFQEKIEGEIQVLPVFFKPSDQRMPSMDEARHLHRHVAMAQKRFRQMLGNRSTFAIPEKPEVYESTKTLAYYQNLDNHRLQVADELIRWKKSDRYDCKFVFLAVVVNTRDKFPRASGAPFNGGFNSGGGLTMFGLHALHKSKKFQSTLQHELGHSFGLNHIDVYGYDMDTNESIMSYNDDHHAVNFRLSRKPGILIPEDIRGLAMNDRVFPNLQFDPKRDVPDGYKLGGIVCFPPMKIVNQPAGIKVSTPSGETYKSKVSNIVHGRIHPSIDRSEIDFKAKRMWHSDKLETGWATVFLDFPKPVTLDRIDIYSQHSGKAHAVVAAKVFTEDGKPELQCDESGLEPYASLSFNSVESKKWKLELKAGKKKMVVVRGLRFFNGAHEMYPQLVPAYALEEQ